MTAFILALVVGALFALGTYLVLRRDLVRVVWGLVIVSQAANAYLLVMGGIAPASFEAVPVLAGHGGEAAETADPLVQALVLTAIVIGFGMTAFALVLSFRVYEEHGTLDVTELADAGGRAFGTEPGGARGPGGDGGAIADGGDERGESAVAADDRDDGIEDEEGNAVGSDDAPGGARGGGSP